MVSDLLFLEFGGFVEKRAAYVVNEDGVRKCASWLVANAAPGSPFDQIVYTVGFDEPLDAGITEEGADGILLYQMELAFGGEQVIDITNVAGEFTVGAGDIGCLLFGADADLFAAGIISRIKRLEEQGSIMLKTQGGNAKSEA